MAVTLKMIADDVGVSISTVSRAINGDPIKKVKAATRKRIAESMARLGYIDDGFASELGLNTNATADAKLQVNAQGGIAERSMGIILASVDKDFSHPFFAEMINHLQGQIYKNGYIVEYVVSESSVGEDKLREIVSSQPVCGAILMGRLSENLLDFFKANIAHLVYTGVNYLGHNTDEVVCNGVSAVAMLYEHFVSIGYSKIAFIGPLATPDGNRNDYHRYMSYVNCLRQYGTPLNEQFVKCAPDTTERGYSAMQELLSAREWPQAIICAADSIAVGVLRAAYENNVSIPSKIAVAGIDNIDISQFLVPSLTTVNVPKLELCRLSVNMLIDKIENRRDKNVRLDIPSDLIIRESCGKNRNRK